MKKSHKIQIFKKSDKMKQNRPQNIDSGRSMVEMLGVLAVIGVLSVASILGYRYAMAKWRANETVNELNIRAYDIATRFDKLVASNTREIEMEMGDTTKLGYPITARISPQYVDYFEMFVSNVPTDVCKELLNSQWQAPYSIFVGIEEYEASSDICEQAENVQLAYEFYKDLSDRDEIPEEVQHKIQRCNHKNNCLCGTCNESIGLCESDCEKGQTCLKRYDDPRWMKCCNKEDMLGNFCCAYVEDGKCCNYDGKCCPPEKPLMDKDGKCYSCDYTGPVSLDDPSTCTATCPKRYMSGGSYPKCVLCGVEGTAVENKPIVNYAGYCFSCTQASAIDMGYGQTSLFPQCSGKCPNQRFMGGGNSYFCYRACTDPERPLFGTDGGCYPCNDTTHSILTKNLVGTCGVDICPGERTIKGDTCIAKCPDNTIRGSDGVCYSCDYTGPVSLDDPSVCTATCPKRYMSGGDYPRCVLCGVKGTAVEDKPIVNYAGYCFSCTQASAIDMGYGQTSLFPQCSGKCPNQRFMGGGNSYFCYRACTTDPERPLFGTDGGCYPCDDTSHSILTKNLVGTCGVDICPGERTIEGDACVAKCPANTIRGSDGVCYSCDYTGPVSLDDPSVCTATCPKRYMSGGDYPRCILCGVKGTAVEDKPIVNYAGYCFGCTQTSGIDMGYGQTSLFPQCAGKCQNQRFMYGYFCYPACTDSTKPLSISDGSCHDCNYKNDTFTINCDKCTNRIVENNSCVRQKCLEGYFEDSVGECYACNITTPIAVKDEEACKVCINRTYKDGMCMENSQ